ncbi:MAG: CARDB domain-containing protein, partial [Thermoplasmata archaeon]
GHTGPLPVPFEISTYSGVVVASGDGPFKSVTLPYGKYYVTVKPDILEISGLNYTIVNGTQYALNVTSPSSNVSISVPSQATYLIKVNVTGVTSSSSLAFKMGNNYVFNRSMVKTGSYQYYLPVKTDFYAVLDYGTTTIITPEYLASTSSILNISAKSSDISGFVSNAASGKIIVIDPVNMTYTVSNYSDNYFNVYEPSGYITVVTSPGYAPLQITSSPSKALNLKASSSQIYYNYSLNSALNMLYLNMTFNLYNGTTIPTFFGNSSIGSLYWQMKYDHNLQTDLRNYFYSYAQNYTNQSIFVNGYNYNLSGVSVSKLYVTSNNTTAMVSAVYENDQMKSGLSTVKLYITGTENLPANLYSYYNFTYNASTIALSSSNVATLTSYHYILIGPQSRNVWANLAFSKVLNPIMTNSSVTFYWNGMVSSVKSAYTLNYSSTNAAYVVEANTTVHANISTAFYNPVTGTDNYANSNFTWTINGTKEYGYNVSYKFYNYENKISVLVRSSTGGVSYSNFTVYAINNTSYPKVSFTASLNGKAIKNTTKIVSTNFSMIYITVPQNSLVSYSVYSSYLHITGTNYNVPLTYAWKFPGKVSSSPNVTYEFTYPSIKSGYRFQYGYANITGENGAIYEIVLNVTVNDTTAPSAVFSIYYNGTLVKNPVAGENVTLTANATTDAYYPFSDLSFAWTIEYLNGTIASPSSTTYYNDTPMNAPYVILKFNTVNSMIISLSVKNPSNVTGYSNSTVSMILKSPRLVVTSIYVPSTPAQGSASNIYVNVSNKGTVNAYNGVITIYVLGKVVGSASFTEIAAGSYKNISVSWTPPSAGKLSVEVTASVSNQPAVFVSAGAL